MYREDQRRSPLVITAAVGHVSALDASSGRVAWGVDLDGIRGVVRLHVDEQRVIALGESELAVMSYLDGKILASMPVGGTTLLVEGERVFVSNRDVVSCVDLPSKKVLWTQKLGAHGVAAIGTPHGVTQGDAGR